jgi:hypothetical protein
MTNRRIGIYLLAMAVCLWGTAASAQVLYTTQEDFSAAVSANGAAITVGPPGVTGDTDGSTTNGLANSANPGGAGTAGALFLQTNTLSYNQANLGDEATNAGFLNALKTHSMFALDYTLPQDIVKGSGGYFEIWGVFNWSGGYQQINNNAFFTDANLLAGKHTVTYDYSALQAGLPTTAPGYFQMFLVLNSGGALTPSANIQVYIDNIRTIPVPEPASLALLGSAVPALVLVARRWRRA